MMIEMFAEIMLLALFGGAVVGFIRNMFTG
jgi:hypothetical protein